MPPRRAASKRTTKTPNKRRGEPDYLVEARARFTMAQEVEESQRQRELDDLRFYAGDQWPDEIKLSRRGQNAQNGLPPVPARPCITISKVRGPVRQILNQEEQSDIGMELVPAEDFDNGNAPLDETEVDLREGLIRRIQRESQAHDAFTWAFARAVIAGRGYFGIMTRYVDRSQYAETAIPDESWWDQEILVQRFYNQNGVTLDPAHEMPDGSDAEWGFVSTLMSKSEYDAEFPHSKDRPNIISSGSAEDFKALGEEYPDWFDTEGDEPLTRVVDYYRVVRTSRTLVRTKDGQTFWADAVPPEVTVTKDDVRRSVTHKTVKWCKLDGVNTQPLDETDWPCGYIPIIKVLGEELQPYDAERRAEGVVRPAREANMGFNVMVSKWIEMIGLAPIPAMELDPEQIEGYEEWYKVLNTRTLPYVPRRTRDDQGREFGPITVTKRDVPIAAVASSVQMFDEATKSETGVPDATLGNVDPSLRSGHAISALVAQSQHGTSNFMSNLVRSIRHATVMINDMLYQIYGRPGRLAQILDEDGKPETIEIAQSAQGAKPAATRPNTRALVLTEGGRFNVTPNVTKNYDTKREQEAAIIGELISSNPQLISWFGDIFFENMDGPGHKEMAARSKAMLAPPIQAQIAQKAQGQSIPPQVQQQLTLAHQGMQKASEEIQQLTAEKQGDVVRQQAETQRTLQKAAIDSSKEVTIQKMKDATSIAVAKINAMTKGVISANEADVEAIALAHDAEQSDLQRQHELSLNTADAGHDQLMSQQGHQQTLDQTAQQAALAPPPAATGDTNGQTDPASGA